MPTEDPRERLSSRRVLSTTRLRAALGRLWTSLRTRRVPIAVNTEHDQEGGRWAEARARFWSELREGQREAEAHSSRQR